MELREVIKRRRSTRRYTGKPVEIEKLQEAMQLALFAPSSKNTRSTRLMAVTNIEKVHSLGALRDYGSSLLEEASAAIVVMGDSEASPMWEINAAIMANTLQLALVDQGLASCWVHVGEYRTIGDDPTSQRSEDFIKERLPEIPAQYRILCVIGIGYADYTPKPLPEYDGPERLLYVK